jgi:hypothetical protein
MSKITAPFTPEIVVHLNRYQRSGWHPYTCGNDDHSSDHAKYRAQHGGDFGELIATPAGWICPVCKYIQDWADDSLLRIVGPINEHEPWAEQKQGIRPVMIQYSIYDDHTTDHPGTFVVRQWHIYKGIGGQLLPGEHRLAPDLETAQAFFIPAGRTKLQRHSADDPTIVEVWV